MAIDTREKRTNVPGVGRPSLRTHHPTSIDEQWRMSVGLSYGGNPLSPGIVPVGTSFIEVGFQPSYLTSVVGFESTYNSIYVGVEPSYKSIPGFE